MNTDKWMQIFLDEMFGMEEEEHRRKENVTSLWNYWKIWSLFFYWLLNLIDDL